MKPSTPQERRLRLKQACESAISKILAPLHGGDFVSDKNRNKNARVVNSIFTRWSKTDATLKKLTIPERGKQR